MEIKEHHWKMIRELFNKSFQTTLHFSLATVTPDNVPHVTPIGSIILRDNKTGFYCEGFSQNIPKNLQSNPRLCVMAINAGKGFWFKSILKGRFPAPPGVRLYGLAGEKRKGTEQELAQWQERVKIFKRFKGYDLLWKGLEDVRDISFDRFEPVQAGAMTQGLWA